MNLLSLLPQMSFGAPLILTALLALPVLWWLLRVTPPLPRRTLFPPLRLLRGLHSFIEYINDSKLVRTLKQRARVRIATDAEAAVTKRPAAYLAIVRDL